MNRRGYDVVNGIVIGEIETRSKYKFYSEKDNRLLLDAGLFDNDQEAIDYFWNKFEVDPYLVKQYKSEGVEMRIWE
ncbi:hypothetical protein LCGC14_0458380 [marine sediment metagenome]|uniref:Uncharacterized protein n=1 Tax=marine sediment metagenome TaxID=412755 RepID=A0A0F9SKX1_9ZZZZ